MDKHYLIKFKDGVDQLKKEAILTQYTIVNVMESFGIYILILDLQTMFSLRKDSDILYIKESSAPSKQLV